MPKSKDKPKKVSRKLQREVDKAHTPIKKKARRLPEKTTLTAITAELGLDTGGASMRPRRAVTTRLPAPRYMVDPVWGPHDADTGASWMEVTIGPAQGGPGMYGAPPANNTPGIMRRLLDGSHNHHGWIAGHLLNDNLGGPGEARNLTPLTTAGNKNHLNACETAIKNFINGAYSRSVLASKDEHYFGVYYKVVVGDTKWDLDHDDLQHVATELLVWAQVVKMHKVTGAISPASYDESHITAWFTPMVGVRVDNTGYDQLPV